LIEGPDGAGKTELAKRLAKDFGLPYHHEGPPATCFNLVTNPITVFNYYIELFNGAISTGKIFDRMVLSEMIYGPLLRNKDQIGGLEGWELFKFKAPNFYTIICLPPLEVCELNWETKKLNNQELIEDREIFLRSYGNFARLALQLNLHFYDYTKVGEYSALVRRLQYRNLDSRELWNNGL
jgi:hypothetical protein